MPVYEEKFISPLAVRFSQEQLRTRFCNGQALDEVTGLVQEVAGVGPYDVILKAPFPNIEVIRWAPGQKRTGTVGMAGMAIPAIPDERSHWFTTDNRRLYVLQKVAARLWPKKAGVQVDVLFAAPPRELFKKYDSSTAGLLASLGGNSAIWDWMKAVSPPDGYVNMAMEEAAHKQVLFDDASGSLEELVSVPQDTPKARPVKEQKAEGDRDADDATDAAATSSTSSGQQSQQSQSQPSPTPVLSPSTKSEKDSAHDENSRVTSEESEESEEEGWWEEWLSLAEHWRGVSRLLEGSWRGPKGETYRMEFCEPSASENVVCGHCVRCQSSKEKTFSVRYEYDSCLLFWGTGRKFCLDPEELRIVPTNARWYVAGKEEPEFAAQLQKQARTYTNTNCIATRLKPVVEFQELLFPTSHCCCTGMGSYRWRTASRQKRRKAGQRQEPRQGPEP